MSNQQLSISITDTQRQQIERVQLRAKEDFGVDLTISAAIRLMMAGYMDKVFYPAYSTPAQPERIQND